MADSSRCRAFSSPLFPSLSPSAYAIYASDIKLQHEAKKWEKEQEQEQEQEREHEEEAKSLRNTRQMGSQTKAAKPEPSRKRNYSARAVPFIRKVFCICGMH